MKDQTKLIAALLVGAAAGAAAALLLAPDSGKATREEIADYFNELVDGAKEKARTAAHDVREYGSGIVDKAKAKFQGAADNASDYTDTMVDTVRSEAGDTIAKGKNKYEDAKAAVKSTANHVNHKVQNA